MVNHRVKKAGLYLAVDFARQSRYCRLGLIFLSASNIQLDFKAFNLDIKIRHKK